MTSPAPGTATPAAGASEDLPLTAVPAESRAGGVPADVLITTLPPHAIDVTQTARRAARGALERGMRSLLCTSALMGEARP